MNKGYSICLNIWALDKDIKNELGLLLIISSLCAEKGYCFASNKYLAELFDITDVSVSTKIKKLEQKNYISIYLDPKVNQWFLSNGYTKQAIPSPAFHNVGDVIALFYSSV